MILLFEIPALKDNSGSKLTSDISKNVPELRRSVFRYNDHVRSEMLDAFYDDYLEFRY